MNVGDLVSTFAASSSPALSAAVLAPLAQETWQLEPPAPHEVPHVLRHEAAVQIDSLLSRVSRGSGALEVAMGEGLASLAVGDRVLRLGYSGIGDYARERLGMAGRTAQAMAHLARELRDRPLLRAAVQRGEVSPRKAEVILAVARGEVELQWVERARVETVRELQAAARGEAAIVRKTKTVLSPEEDARAMDEDESWERICVPLAPADRTKLDQAMELAGKLLGATAPKWQRLEAICQEYLGVHPSAELGEDTPGAEVAESDRYLLRSDATVRALPDDLREFLETETARWSWLETVQPVEAPNHSDDVDRDPFQLDEELRRLASMRERWDELVGHLGMLLRMLGLWRELGFASFSHYCTERLGMAPRTVEQRAWLERRFYALPALRRAMRQGRLSYEKARLVAGCADDTTVGDWIKRAEKATCIALRREIESLEQKQMCAQGELDQRVPKRVASLLSATFRAVREAERRWLSPGECLERVAQHFIEVWKETLNERSTPQKRVLVRDHGYCQVPGCSRAAAHAHHVLYRSLGGGNQGENLVGLCAAHHLQCVHRGWVRVRGQAPDGLIWKLGVRTGREPLVVVGRVRELRHCGLGGLAM